MTRGKKPSCTAWLRERERAADQRLRRDDRRRASRARPARRSAAPRGTIAKNGFAASRGIGEHERALPKYASKSDGKTRQSHASRIGLRAEVAHVRVERLAAGDREHDRAEHEEARACRDAAKKRTAWRGIDRAEDARVLARCARAPSPPIDEEPDDHHRPEEAADALGSALWIAKRPTQDRARDRDDVRA